MESIQINIIPVTPLCQINGTEGNGNKSILAIKKQGRIVNVNVCIKSQDVSLDNEDDNIEKAEGNNSDKKDCVDTQIKEVMVNAPYYTANGFRGLLRRKASEILFSNATKKGIAYSHDSYFLHFAGGSSAFTSSSKIQPDFSKVLQIKELNPLVSLFGTTLLVEGKLIVSDLTIPDTFFQELLGDKPLQEKNADWIVLRKLVEENMMIKFDDIMQRTKFSRFLTAEDIAKWQEIVSKSKDNKKKNNEQKQDIKNIINKEYIKPGIKLRGFIGFKEEPTKVELGLLYSALKEITNEQLGSTKNLGYGICKWHIKRFKDSKIATIMNSKTDDGKDYLIKREPHPENLFAQIIDDGFDREAEEYIKCFNEWLENMTEEHINIDRFWKDKQKSNGSKSKTKKETQKDNFQSKEKESLF